MADTQEKQTDGAGIPPEEMSGGGIAGGARQQPEEESRGMKALKVAGISVFLAVGLAFSVAFPRWLTALYTVFLVVIYWMICTLTPDSDQMITFIRILMITAVAFCGSLLLTIERSRRREAIRDVDDLRFAVND